MKGGGRSAASGLVALRNLGSASADMLHAAGITTERQLRRRGAVAAFAAVRAAGASPSLNLLWALEGALSNRDWKAVARDDRTRLLMALEDHKMDRALAVPVRRRQR
jgi:DNA transformation protein